VNDVTYLVARFVMMVGAMLTLHYARVEIHVCVAYRG